MTRKEKEKIADDYFKIFKKAADEGKEIKPTAFDFVVNRIMGFFPHDAVQISMILNDKLVSEKIII